MPQAPRHADDESIDREIARLDLTKLDLSALDDEASLLGMPHALPSSRGMIHGGTQFRAPDGSIRSWARWVVTGVLCALGAFVLWFPTSGFYYASGARDTWFMVICLTGTIVGIGLARWLWHWGEEVAARAHPQQRVRKPLIPWTIPPAVVRWGILLFVVGGSTAIVLTNRSGVGVSGSGHYSGAWYITAIGAVCLGLLGVRWIFLAANQHNKDGDGNVRARKPIVLPPWFKWVTFTGLIIAGLVTAFGGALMGNGGSADSQYGFGGLGFIVGVCGAIWIARRFDETEKKIREQTRQRRP